MKIIEMMFYGVTTKGVLHTFIESYSNFPITFFNIFNTYLFSHVTSGYRLASGLSLSRSDHLHA